MVTDLNVTIYKNYDKHAALATFIDPPTGAQGFVAFYRLNMDFPAFGATRVWQYPSYRDGVEDALRLAKTMMYKNAMAGTPYGGAKGIIVSSLTNPSEQRALLLRYARFINFLSGRFITGADVGVSNEDVKAMKKVSKQFIVGTKVDPVLYTVKGLLCGLNIAVKEVFGTEDMSEKTIAIQGVGKVGAKLIQSLHNKVKSIYIADTQKKVVNQYLGLYKNIIVVSPDDIYKQKTDIFCPCAMGGVINSKSIKKIISPLIVGSANNQLENDEIGDKLHQMGIFYAPDYVVNAGGVMSVVYEYEHEKLNKHDLDEQIKKVGTNLQNVINYAHTHNTSMSRAANHLTERMFQSKS